MYAYITLLLQESNSVTYKICKMLCLLNHTMFEIPLLVTRQLGNFSFRVVVVVVVAFAASRSLLAGSLSLRSRGLVSFRDNQTTHAPSPDTRLLRTLNLVPRVLFLSPGSKREDPGNEVGERLLTCCDGSGGGGGGRAEGSSNTL